MRLCTLSGIEQRRLDPSNFPVQLPPKFQCLLTSPPAISPVQPKTETHKLGFQLANPLAQRTTTNSFLHNGRRAHA